MSIFVTPDRVEPPLLAGEREAMEGFLDWYRDALLAKCAGLDGEQLARRAVPPSTLSLLGLVRHLTDVERSWFRRVLEGDASAGPLHHTEDNRDGDFDDGTPGSAEADRDAYLAELAVVRAVAARHALDDVGVHPVRGPLNLRWIYLHLIEEYARHLGHADLLRERIDGVTGD